MTPATSAAAFALLPAATEGPDLQDPYVVSPGMAGFLVFLVLALACWLLYRSLLTQLRRVDVRARLRAEEAAAARAAAGADAPAGDGPAGDGPEESR